MATIRIATRKSPLAMWQAEHVRDRLAEAHPGLSVELVPMSTSGDKLLDAPLAKVGGKGLFVKELEAALLDQRADIAVHSMKDVPVEFPDGLHLAVILNREDPSDAFVSNRHAALAALPEGARVGTSSLRRKCQLRAWRQDLELLDLRGNVNTRLRRLDEGDFDAIILASAGLKRLGMDARIGACLEPGQMLPAIGQGAIGIECRVGDSQAEILLDVLHHQHTAIRVRAERAMNRVLGGGCQVPLAGYATISDDVLELTGLLASLDGRRVLRASARASTEDPEALGSDVAEELRGQGADAILAEVYAAQ